MNSVITGVHQEINFSKSELAMYETDLRRTGHVGRHYGLQGLTELGVVRQQTAGRASRLKKLIRQCADAHRIGFRFYETGSKRRRSPNRDDSSRSRESLDSAISRQRNSLHARQNQ